VAAPTLHAEFNQTASPGTSGTSTAIAVSPGDLLTVVFIVDVESSGTPSFRVKNNDATSGHNLITEEETIAPSATGTKIYADGSASTQIWDVRARSSAATGIVYVWSVRIDAASTSNSLAIVYTVPINTRARYSTRTSTPASGNVWPVRASRVQASGTLTDWATGGGDQTLTLSTVDDGRREMLISGLDQGGSTDSVVTLDADHDGSFEISDTDLGTVGAHVFYGYYDRTDAHRPGTGSSNDQKLVAHCSTSWGTNSGNAWAAIVYAAERPFVAITFPTETDSNPAALGRLKSRTLGLASDTEIALPMTQAHQPKFIPIARVDEPDSAITIRPTHRNTLGYPTETDSSIHVTRSRYITFPTETDTAQPLSQILTLTGEVGLAAPDPDCALIALRVTAYKAYAADVGDIHDADRLHAADHRHDFRLQRPAGLVADTPQRHRLTHADHHDDRSDSHRRRAPGNRTRHRPAGQPPQDQGDYVPDRSGPHALRGPPQVPRGRYRRRNRLTTCPPRTSSQYPPGNRNRHGVHAAPRGQYPHRERSGRDPCGARARQAPHHRHRDRTIDRLQVGPRARHFHRRRN
jgi:hypothetical protein